MQNVEWKARVADSVSLRRRLADLGLTQVDTLIQLDTFFDVPNGRLKLREVQSSRGSTAEWIYYHRANQAAARVSNYWRAEVANAADTIALFERVVPKIGSVRKQRRLYLHETTRLHLDHVEKLGDYLEIEVVLKDGIDQSEGERRAKAWQHDLGIAPEDIIPLAYIDLLVDLEKSPIR